MVGPAQTLKMALGDLRLAVISPCVLLLDFVQTKKSRPKHVKEGVHFLRTKKSLITQAFTLSPLFSPSMSRVFLLFSAASKKAVGARARPLCLRA